MDRMALGLGHRLLIAVALIIVCLAGCGPSAAELAAVDYAPQAGGDWPVSTPAEEGLDPQLVAALYHDAAGVETLDSLLVVKNGYLIAEDYFHDGAPDEVHKLQSVTKSFTGAMVGLALEEGCLSSLDQHMIDFFPELAGDVTDPRKEAITLREMLQMRAGYPWEESSAELFELLYNGFHTANLVEVPLATDPRTQFAYSNMTSYLLSVIVARACDTDLLSYAQARLFDPLGIEVVEWLPGWEGYRTGHAELFLRSRDMAKFGQLYLDGGQVDGQQIIPAAWIDESWQVYSEDAWQYRVGRNFQDIGYGYQWWRVRAGDHRYHLAWGHGGQQIAVLDDLDMVIVVTADPLHGEHGDKPWRREKENLNLVADFIASLPAE